MAAPRNRIYVLLIAILLVSNLAMVAFFVLNRQQRPKRENNSPRSYMEQSLKSEVGFTDDQIKRFDTMADGHRKAVRRLFEDLNRTKENFYKMLSQGNVPDSTLKTAASEIGRKQETLDLAIFSHFQSIRSLATPEQLPKLDSVLQRVVKRMIAPPRRPGDKKQDSSRDKRPN